MKSGFGQICPVAVACEVFAQRWTPIILREMFAGFQHFNVTSIAAFLSFRGRSLPSDCAAWKRAA